jgi:hypothetical protein
MDRVTYYEWHGRAGTLTVLCLLVFTIPLAVVYFLTRLVRIETEVQDAAALSELLRARG